MWEAEEYSLIQWGLRSDQSIGFTSTKKECFQACPNINPQVRKELSMKEPLMAVTVAAMVHKLWD